MPPWQTSLLTIFAIMRNSVVFLFLPFLMLMASCGSQSKIEGSFTEEELSWLVYKDGDNLLFQNPDSVGDEIMLFISAPKNPSQLRTYYPIEAEVSLGNPEKGDFFKIYLLKDERDFKRYLKFSDTYLSFEVIEPLKAMKIGDVTYQEVYVFKEDSTAAAGNISEVYFCKGHGVVQYSTKDGRNFQLFNNELVEQNP